MKDLFSCIVLAGAGFAFAGGYVSVTRYQYQGADGHTVRLTPREMSLVRLFASREGDVLTREELFSEAWGGVYYRLSRTIDQHIARLRRKLGPEGSRIQSVSGVGYVFRGIRDEG